MSRVDVTTEKIVSAALAESKRLEQLGRFEEALQRLEKVLSETDNESIPSAVVVAKRAAALCNRLVQGASEKAVVKYLRTAEQAMQAVLVRSKVEGVPMQEGCFRLTILTFNNWATYHKDRKSYHMALNYLMRAAKLTDSMGEILSPDTLELCAKTKLSASALYSDLRRYPEAVELAEQCLATLQLELNLRLAARGIEDLQGKEKAKFDSMIGTYIVAFYNIGAAEEAQGSFANAVEAYKNAVTIGKRFMNTEHPVLELAIKALSDIPQETEDNRETEKHPHLSSEAYRDILGERLREAQVPLEEPLLMKSRTSIISPLSSRNLSDSRSEMKEDESEMEQSFAKDDQFKYYTPEQLAKLKQKLSKGSGLNFVSADKYFFTKITKTLNVSQDVKYLRPLTA